MTDASIVDRMAATLRKSGIDLNDERAVIRALNAAGFLDGDIIIYSDEATATCQRIEGTR